MHHPAAPAPAPAAPQPQGPTAEDAKAFVAKVNAELLKLWTRQSTAEWIKSTYITDDTERNAAAVDEEVMEYLGQAVKEAARFQKVKNLDPDVQRSLTLLRFNIRRHGIDYLAGQIYFDPHPKELMLRNHV